GNSLRACLCTDSTIRSNGIAARSHAARVRRDAVEEVEDNFVGRYQDRAGEVGAGSRPRQRLRALPGAAGRRPQPARAGRQAETLRDVARRGHLAHGATLQLWPYAPQWSLSHVTAPV